MTTALSWGQFGLAGLIAITLGSVIAYIFKLLVNGYKQEKDRLVAELADANVELAKLHDRLDERQRASINTLADVAHAMADVQKMLREREIESRVEQGIRERQHGG